MSQYSSFSDDYYVNMHLHTEMDLPDNRETLLHFFEQIRKTYPLMNNFYNRARSDLVLEEDKESGSYRWVTLESRRICSGQVNPSTIDSAIEQHTHVLEHVPYALSVSPLDCESLNIMFGFDYNYRGNHNELLAEALGISPAFEPLVALPGARIVGNEPCIQVALDSDCRTQCRVNVESRTTAAHMRAGEYPEEQLSVYLTARRFGTPDNGESFVSTAHDLANICRDIVDRYLIENILQPLQTTITTM